MRTTIAGRIRRQNKRRPKYGSSNIDVISSAFVLSFPGQFIEMRHYADEFSASMRTVDGYSFQGCGRNPIEAIERMFEICSRNYKRSDR